MPENTVVHLSEGRAFWTPDSTGVEVELDVTEVKISLKRDLAEYKPSKSAGWTRRKPGFKDVSGTVNVIYKTDEKPYDATRNLAAGERGSFRFTVDEDGTDAYAGPAFIGEEISDTVFSGEDVKVLEIPFSGDGEWTYPGAA